MTILHTNTAFASEARDFDKENDFQTNVRGLKVRHTLQKTV